MVGVQQKTREFDSVPNVAESLPQATIADLSSIQGHLFDSLVREIDNGTCSDRLDFGCSFWFEKYSCSLEWEASIYLMLSSWLVRSRSIVKPPTIFIPEILDL